MSAGTRRVVRLAARSNTHLANLIVSGITVLVSMLCRATGFRDLN
jgi:hypothetical protein